MLDYFRSLGSITKKQWVVFLPPFLAILLYILIASYKISYPGVQYDESLYLNAAHGGVDTITFMTKTYHGFPVLLMPYIGALKAYIFYPIFALFKVSAVTMRLPNIIFSALGLVVLYKLLRSQIGTTLSVFILFLTSLDASFIMFTRLDNGPVVLDFLLKVIGLFALLKFSKLHNKRWLCIFWLAMFLGVFNKLNFIWYVNAFPLAYLIIYGKNLWRKATKSQVWQLFIISAVSYILIVSYYLYINTSYHLGSNFGFLGWKEIYSIIAPLVSGTWFYNYALSTNSIGSNSIFWIMLGAIILGAIIYVFRISRAKSSYNKKIYNFYGFMLISLVLLLGQIAFTKQATAGWHYFDIYPLFGTVFILSVFFIFQSFANKKRELITACLLIVTGAFCLYQLNIYRQYIDTYNKAPANVIWTPAIYSLINYAKAQPNSQFISMDWGTQTQLIGFNPIKNKYYEVFGPINTNDPTQVAVDYNTFVATKPNAFYVGYVTQFSGAPQNSKQLFQIAKSYGKQPRIVKVIDYKDQPIYDIYRLD